MFTSRFLPFLLLGVIFMNTPTSNGMELFPKALQSTVGDALEAIFAIGAKVDTLLNTNSSQPQNFLVSPLSLTLLLGQLIVGADGRFKEHLYDLISLSKRGNAGTGTGSAIVPDVYDRLIVQQGRLVDMLKAKANVSYTLDTHNAVFYNKRIKLRDEFTYNSQTLYQTQFYPLNFKRSEETMNTINKWAFDHTNGLISNILATPPGVDTAAIFANAVYFNGKWEQPFSSELNHLGAFHATRTSSTQVTYMANFLEQVPFAESKRLNCKLLVLPYERMELGMYIILPNVGHPDEFDISAFSSRTKISDYLELLADLKQHDVNVKIPKFSLSSSLSLLKPLQVYSTYKRYMQSRQAKPAAELSKAVNVLDDLEHKKAMFESFKRTFSNNTLQSNIDDIILGRAREDGNLAVSDVLQHLTFKMNEMGTEAAAVTAGIIDYSGGSKTFLANKPFMFFIRHEATAATLFWGTISNP